MPTLVHEIILDAVDNLQGVSITGAGTLETLKGLMPTVEVIHDIPEINRSLSAIAVMEQADVVAELFEDGFTATTLAAETATLESLVNAYLNSES